MSYIQKFDLKDSISRTYFILLCFLPIIIFGLLAFILFVNFLGLQANEITRLVRDLELQCEFEAGLRDVGITGAQCADYIPRIGFFFFFTLSWLIVSTIVTVRLFEFAKSKTVRLITALFATAALPALFMLKYLTAIGVFSSFLIALTSITALFSLILIFNFDRISRWTQDSLIINYLFIISTVTFLIISISFSFFDKNIFSFIGTLNTVFLSIILVYAFLGSLFYFSRTTGIPWVTGLFAWVLILNISGWNDRLPVELRPVDSKSQVTGDDQFLKWLDARQDLAAYETAGQDYPVYIVASAGGGTYASLRTAYMLTYLQKICPSFAHHTFAISSVSGGGFGALAFASQHAVPGQRDLRPCEPIDVRQLTASPDDKAIQPDAPSVLDIFFARDQLSTLVGAGLFPDMLQRALPFPIRELDRSVAYTDAVGQYWREAAQSVESMRTAAPAADGLGCPPEEFFGKCEIASYWDPAGDVPILIFNTTDVDTGTPIILSNLSQEFYSGTLAYINRREFVERSIYLIDAASLSARFPVALPAGFLPQMTDVSSWFRLVDGGYFDTSGLITAEAVKKRIEKISAERGRRVKVRMIFLGEWSERVPPVTETPPQQPETTAKIIALLSASAQGKGSDSPGGSELDAHAAALFNARDQRTNFVVSQFLETIDTTLALRWDPLAKGGFTPHCQDVPLAWYLAPCTQQLARSRLDDALFAAEPELAKLREDLAR